MNNKTQTKYNCVLVYFLPNPLKERLLEAKCFGYFFLNKKFPARKIKETSFYLFPKE